MSKHPDQIDPMEFYPKGACPKCKKLTMALRIVDTSYLSITKNGYAREEEATLEYIPRCMNCGYEPPIIFERLDGGYCFPTEAECIHLSDEKAKKMTELIKFRRGDVGIKPGENPFMEAIFTEIDNPEITEF